MKNFSYVPLIFALYTPSFYGMEPNTPSQDSDSLLTTVHFDTDTETVTPPARPWALMRGLHYIFPSCCFSSYSTNDTELEPLNGKTSLDEIASKCAQTITMLFKQPLWTGETRGADNATNTVSRVLSLNTYQEAYCYKIIYDAAIRNLETQHTLRCEAFNNSSFTFIDNHNTTISTGLYQPSSLELNSGEMWRIGKRSLPDNLEELCKNTIEEIMCKNWKHASMKQFENSELKPALSYNEKKFQLIIKNSTSPYEDDKLINVLISQLLNSTQTKPAIMISSCHWVSPKNKTALPLDAPTYMWIRKDTMADNIKLFNLAIEEDDQD